MSEEMPEKYRTMSGCQKKCQEKCHKERSGHRLTVAKTRDKEERITLMKSRLKTEGLQILSEISAGPRPRQILSQRMSE